MDELRLVLEALVVAESMSCAVGACEKLVSTGITSRDGMVVFAYLGRVELTIGRAEVEDSIVVDKLVEIEAVVAVSCLDLEPARNVLEIETASGPGVVKGTEVELANGAFDGGVGKS